MSRSRREPVRVAHVIHNLSPGGTERRLLSVVEGLDRARFSPLIVCIDRLGVLGEGTGAFVLGRPRRVDPIGVARLAALLARERVEIVHGWLSLANAYARLAAIAARVPVRIAAEGGAVTTRDARRAKRDTAIEKVLASVTDAYVANSRAVAESLRSKGLPTDRIVVIPNGVGPAPPPAARSELGARPEEGLMGMVARLDSGFKDHETFLAAVAALVAEGRSVRAAVIGDGPARNALESLTRELGLAGRVVFMGYRADARALLGALDVCVLLTFSEGFSNVALEAMAAGRPLVLTDIAPNREAAEHGVHALFVPVGDAAAAAAAVGRLLDDRDLATRLGEAARLRVETDFSLAAQAHATMELYDRLLAAKRR